jgi:hypothetical protein
MSGPPNGGRVIPPPSGPPPTVEKSSTAPGYRLLPALSPAGELPSSPAPPDEHVLTEPADPEVTR